MLCHILLEVVAMRNITMQQVQGADEVSSSIPFGQAAAAVGLMTLEKFAEAVGLPPGVVLGHLNRGMLPTVTLGRRRLINVVALQRELGRKEFAL
jgi:hypothetical protein